MFTALGAQEVSGNDSLSGELTPETELKAGLIKSDLGNATLRSIGRSQTHRRKSLGKIQEERETGFYLVKMLH